MFDDNNQQSPEIRVSQYKNPKSDKRWIWTILGIAAIIVLGLSLLFIRSQKQLKTAKEDLKNVKSNPGAVLQEDNKQLIEKIGKLIILPENEEPTIATVTDLDKLKGQPFFAKAELGDKVLIYSKAKKAVLYRPSSNQVIELAPLLDGTDTPAAPTAGTVAQPIR